MKGLARLSITSALLIGHTYAEVKLVREFLLKPPRDRRALFAMAVTPEQDVLSLVGNDDGSWRLSRVRGWLDEQPIEQTLRVQGLFQGGNEGWSNWGIWSAELSVTFDGKFAVCIVSAHSKSGTREDVITVVGLAEFKTATTLRSSALMQVKGNFREYHLDRSGHLVVNASTSFSRRPGDDAFFGGASHQLAVFGLPSMDIKERCEYSEWVRSGKPIRRENEGSCASLLQRSGVRSLDDLSKTFLKRVRQSQEDEKAQRGGCAILTYSTYLSPDGRFRWERCTGGHRGFWGNFVVSHAVENIFLVDTGQKLGSIKVPNNHLLNSRFAIIEGREFLLVVEGGTRLSVYEITR